MNPRLAVILLLFAGAARAGVTLDASVGIQLGDQTDVSARLFGITAFEGFPNVVADADYRAKVAALRPGMFRFGGNLDWCAPPAYDPAWFDGDEALQRITQTLLFGDKYAFGRFAPVIRQMGAEPVFSFAAPAAYLCYEKTNRPADFDQWAAYCAGYVALWKRFDPQLRAVQTWNEPNADWFQDPRGKEHGAAALHIDMANRVARAVKARFPEMLVGGPVLCWPPAWPADQQGQQPWYTWQMWTVPWLEQTRETIDFYDFHSYNVSPEDFAVQTEMLVNEAERIQGRRIPVWITESNYDVPEAELADPKAIWTKRMLPYERYLLRGILPQADKVAVNLVHDLHARHFTILPRGADDPDPMYQLLWILRDLRGARVLADSDDPDVLSFATVEEDRVTLVLFNDSATAKDVPLSLTLPTGYFTGPVVRAIGEGADGTPQRIAVAPKLERTPNTAHGTVPLPPRATASLSFRMMNFGAPARRRVTHEWFGDRTLQFLQPGAPVRFIIRATPDAKASWALRLGLLGPAVGDGVGVTFNGRPLEATATALQDLAVPADAVKAENVVEVTGQPAQVNPRLAVGFAALVSTSNP
ncbi:MAG: hypothetical protein HYU66_02240 [Armatimonadetes bacterium]|nr:hypothetical protein [Armatimonadota bacterium]